MTFFTISANGEFGEAVCECLGPQQIWLSCRHLFSGHNHLSFRVIQCPIIGSSREKHTGISSSKLEFFPQVAGKRWQWREEQSLSARKLPMRKGFMPRISHSYFSCADMDEEENEPEEIFRDKYSEMARSTRYKNILAVSQRIAAFASGDIPIFKIMRLSFQQLFGALEFFLKTQRPPFRLLNARAAYDQYGERATANIPSRTPRVSSASSAVEHSASR